MLSVNSVLAQCKLRVNSVLVQYAVLNHYQLNTTNTHSVMTQFDLTQHTSRNVNTQYADSANRVLSQNKHKTFSILTSSVLTQHYFSTNSVLTHIINVCRVTAPGGRIIIVTWCHR